LSITNTFAVFLTQTACFYLVGLLQLLFGLTQQLLLCCCSCLLGSCCIFLCLHQLLLQAADPATQAW
jgi:hypothetical protein